jgi:Uncharacterized conserved protein (DUF2183)
MSELYRKWAGLGAHVHYVSNGPWQLFPMLSDFFAKFNFPPGSAHLRIIDRNDVIGTIRGTPGAHKLEAIPQIMNVSRHCGLIWSIQRLPIMVFFLGCIDSPWLDICSFFLLFLRYRISQIVNSFLSETRVNWIQKCKFLSNPAHRSFSSSNHGVYSISKTQIDLYYSYQKVYQQFPDRIVKVYIHDVTSERAAKADLAAEQAKKEAATKGTKKVYLESLREAIGLHATVTGEAHISNSAVDAVTNTEQPPVEEVSNDPNVPPLTRVELFNQRIAKVSEGMREGVFKLYKDPKEIYDDTVVAAAFSEVAAK